MDSNNKKENNEIDDVIFEELDSEGEETSNPQAVIKKLREKLKIAVEEKQKYLENWQRDKADFVNARKRDEDDRVQIIKFAKEDAISELIPVVDAFDLAMGQKEAWEALPKDWRTGMESISSQIGAILTQNGVLKIYPIGEPFDPKNHEAIATVTVDKKEQDHTVIDVLQSGFSIHGKVIRPAKVRVGEYKNE
jgi:molecular chaperone GrpE